MKSSSLNNISEQLPMLKALSCCSENMRKSILKKADRKLVQAICECCFNAKREQLSAVDLIKLSKYKKSINKLTEKSNLKTKRNILVQQGGFLNILLPAVITGVSALIDAIRRK